MILFIDMYQRSFFSLTHISVVLLHASIKQKQNKIKLETLTFLFKPQFHTIIKIILFCWLLNSVVITINWCCITLTTYNNLAIFSLVRASITIQSGFYTHEWTVSFSFYLILFYGRFFTFLCRFQVYYYSFHIKSTHMWMLENKATYNKKKNNNMYAMLNGN